MAPAIPSIFGSGTPIPQERDPVNELAAIFNNLVAAVPDESHLEDFEQTLFDELAFIVRGYIDVEYIAGLAEARGWFENVREDVLRTWMTTEGEITRRILELEGTPRCELEAEVEAIVFQNFRRVEYFLLGINHFSLPERVLREYMKGVTSKYNAKAQILLETSIGFFAQFG